MVITAIICVPNSWGQVFADHLSHDVIISFINTNLDSVKRSRVDEFGSKSFNTGINRNSAVPSTVLSHSKSFGRKGGFFSLDGSTRSLLSIWVIFFVVSKNKLDLNNFRIIGTLGEDRVLSKVAEMSKTNLLLGAIIVKSAFISIRSTLVRLARIGSGSWWARSHAAITIIESTNLVIVASRGITKSVTQVVRIESRPVACNKAIAINGLFAILPFCATTSDVINKLY